jgi:hypothetical protein
MSNVTQEFCSADATLPCTTWSFMGQAAADPAVNSSHLVIVDGALGGATAVMWESSDAQTYDRIRDVWLEPMGLSELQVQIAWIKQANPRPGVSLPDSGADAFELVTQLANIVRAMKLRYPNLKLIFLSSRTYGGYAVTNLNPEPYAYETGFSVKWLIEAQIEQMSGGGSAIDALAGDLDYDAEAPWLGWGPYLWADGSIPNSDGLSWAPEDFEGDGTHPSASGEEKVGSSLLNFFKTSPLTAGWFLQPSTMLATSCAATACFALPSSRGPGSARLSLE